MPPSRVWHCSLRTAPEDPWLSDWQWATVARRIAHATDSEHHIHLAGVTVLPDGSRPGMHRAAVRAQAECLAIEADWGLRPVGQDEGLTTSYPTTAEIIKAEQHGWAEPSRVWLQRQMRQALQEATTVDGYAEALAARGVLVRWRTDAAGSAVGYSLARPGDTGTGGKPVFFAAGRLDSALTLPRLRQALSADVTAL
ncbi:hypothetical protein ACIPLC_15715 [Kitasatospora sp. NPDC086801]|uniref:hypothetical protein n=1 Tax=unclassified Kitasatospora TaxID=2633591 RepID=UPI0037F2D1F8